MRLNANINQPAIKKTSWEGTSIFLQNVSEDEEKRVTTWTPRIAVGIAL